MTSKLNRSGSTAFRTQPAHANSAYSPSPEFEKAVKRDRRLREMSKGEGRGQGWPYKRCTPQRPCRSAACLPCRHRTHELFVEDYLLVAQSVWAAAEAECGGKMKTINIVPSFGRIPRGQLHTADLVKIREKMLRLVRYHAARAKTYLFLDISLNHDADQPHKEHWQIHAHGLVLNLSPKAKKKLAKALRRGRPGRGIPLLLDEITDLPGWLKYMSKPRFRKRMPNPDAMPSETPQRDLTLKEDCELNRWLRKYRVDQLTGMIGKEVWS